MLGFGLWQQKPKKLKARNVPRARISIPAVGLQSSPFTDNWKNVSVAVFWYILICIWANLTFLLSDIPTFYHSFLKFFSRNCNNCSSWQEWIVAWQKFNWFHRWIDPLTFWAILCGLMTRRGKSLMLKVDFTLKFTASHTVAENIWGYIHPLNFLETFYIWICLKIRTH